MAFPMARTPAKSPVKKSSKNTGVRAAPTEKTCSESRCSMNEKLEEKSCSAPERPSFMRVPRASKRSAKHDCEFLDNARLDNARHKLARATASGIDLNAEADRTGRCGKCRQGKVAETCRLLSDLTDQSPQLLKCKVSARSHGQAMLTGEFANFEHKLRQRRKYVWDVQDVVGSRWGL
eukprot:6183543-Pleurochrysis_carterae.AAC.1